MKQVAILLSLMISFASSPAFAAFVQYQISDTIETVSYDEYYDEIIDYKSVYGSFYYDIENVSLVAGIMDIEGETFLMDSYKGVGNSNLYMSLHQYGFYMGFDIGFQSQNNPNNHFSLNGEYEIGVPLDLYPCIEIDACPTTMYDEIPVWQDAEASGALIEGFHEGFLQYDSGESGDFWDTFIEHDSFRLVDELPDIFKPSMKVPDSSYAAGLLLLLLPLVKRRR
ncbi:hypothetical protein EZV61_04045 [Corallincola luteus]|uniref:Uncharacterized protein n=1 Tax=Corallincola luteus TaxID=1775177 RepID=A0ABY2APL6_9GAMM|nr:hypothetical protein [Corallincola luteus]TCI05141.1 hypothetical protein EZV61_04045 [Corallincola luteus]